MQEEFDYKAAYERERQTNIRLGEKLVALESSNALLSAKVNKLKNSLIFGSDLTATPLADRIREYFLEELAGPGAVRATLQKHLPADEM